MFCRLFSVFSLLLILFRPGSVLAESKLVVTVSGKDITEAQVRAVRQAVLQTNVAEKFLIKSVLEQEVIPYAAQFVSSFKVLPSGGLGRVTLEASVDIELLRSLVSITAKSFGDEKSQKVLLVSKGPRLASGKEDTSYTKPLAGLLDSRLKRRSFLAIEPTESIKEQIVLAEDILAPEFLSSLGKKSEAVLVWAIEISLGQVENENSHNSEERIFLEGLLLDVNKNSVLARHKVSSLAPVGKREGNDGAIEGIVQDKAGDLMQELWVKGGEQFARVSRKAESGLLLRVIEPSAAQYQQFRALLEAEKDIQRVLESTIRRGVFDILVDTKLKAKQLGERCRSLLSETFFVEIVPADQELAKGADVALRLKAKTVQSEPKP